MRLTADKIPLGGTGLAEGVAVCYPVIEQGGTLRRPPTVERRREPVKITVEHRAGAENEVVLRCAALDEEMLWVFSLLRSGLQRLCVWSESREVVLLRPEEVVYCESVDERTFVYTADGVTSRGLDCQSWKPGMGRWVSSAQGSPCWSTCITSAACGAGRADGSRPRWRLGSG